MPDFPDYIQDLISRMLTVPTDERITMEGIKNHPAFRIGLPDNYIVPTPLPIPLLNEPIDPSTIDPKIIGILKNIGYGSDEEINAEFTSPTHTNAKVFYMMFKKSIAYDSLQWPGADSDPDNQIDNYVAPDDAFFMSPRQIPMGGQTRANDPFHRRIQAPDVSSPEVRSLIQRPEWFSMDSNAEVEQIGGEDENVEQEFEGIPIQLEYLMQGLQIFLTQNDLKWFHQSDMELIAKSFELNMLVTFTCTYQSMEMLKLTLALKRGNKDQFTKLIEEVHDCISSMIQNVPQESA